VIFRIENTGDPLPNDLLQWIANFNSDTDLLHNQSARQGLGLTIVQKILLLHDSVLHAKYENGCNIFSFSLPIYKHTI
jgi:nitrogen-specific signal transduction histidine kinase